MATPNKAFLATADRTVQKSSAGNGSSRGAFTILFLLIAALGLSLYYDYLFFRELVSALFIIAAALVIRLYSHPFTQL